MHHQFIVFLLQCSIQCTCYTICLFMFLLMDICVISSFWLMFGLLQGKIQFPSLGSWFPGKPLVVVLYWLGQAGPGNCFQASLFFLLNY